MRLYKFICFLLFALMLFSINASAFVPGDTIRMKPVVKQKKPYPSQPVIIKTSPTAFLDGGALIIPFASEYRLTAELCTAKKQSEQVSLSIIRTNAFLSLFEKISGVPNSKAFKATGWRIQYAHKFYLVNKRHHAPYGFYVAPLFSYTDAHLYIGLNRFYRNSYYDFQHFNADLIAGVQFGKAHRLTVDISGGVGYKNNVIYAHVSSFKVFKYDSTDFGTYYNNHLNILFDISLGYSFK